MERKSATIKAHLGVSSGRKFRLADLTEGLLLTGAQICCLGWHGLENGRSSIFGGDNGLVWHFAEIGTLQIEQSTAFPNYEYCVLMICVDTGLMDRLFETPPTHFRVALFVRGVRCYFDSCVAVDRSNLAF